MINTLLGNNNLGVLSNSGIGSTVRNIAVRLGCIFGILSLFVFEFVATAILFATATQDSLETVNIFCTVSYIVIGVIQVLLAVKFFKGASGTVKNKVKHLVGFKKDGTEIWR